MSGTGDGRMTGPISSFRGGQDLNRVPETDGEFKLGNLRRV